jgi:hypothetical protein
LPGKSLQSSRLPSVAKFYIDDSKGNPASITACSAVLFCHDWA